MEACFTMVSTRLWRGGKEPGGSTGAACVRKTRLPGPKPAPPTPLAGSASRQSRAHRKQLNDAEPGSTHVVPNGTQHAGMPDTKAPDHLGFAI
jgi:hypothetical protein